MTKQDEIFNFIASCETPVSMAQIAENFQSPQKQVKALVAAGKVGKKIYCFGSGGFDGLGFRTRPWVYVYFACP